MPNLTKLNQYLKLIDQLINLADKAELAECARLLAMNIAHYEMQFGKLPLEDTLVAMNAATFSDEQLELVENGMETLAGVLSTVLRGVDEKTEH